MFHNCYNGRSTTFNADKNNRMQWNKRNKTLHDMLLYESNQLRWLFSFPPAQDSASSTYFPLKAGSVVLYSYFFFYQFLTIHIFFVINIKHRCPDLTLQASSTSCYTAAYFYPAMTLTYGLAPRRRVLAVRPDRDEIGWHPVAPQYASGRGGWERGVAWMLCAYVWSTAGAMAICQAQMSYPRNSCIGSGQWKIAFLIQRTCQRPPCHTRNTAESANCEQNCCRLAQISANLFKALYLAVFR